MNIRKISLYLAGMLLLFFTWHPPRPAHAQTTTTPYDCNFTFSFTGTGAQTGVPNSTASRPCVAWRYTYTTTGFSTVTVQFETSPDNSSWTAIPNTICSSSVQPPCLTDGASPTTGAQGTAAIRAYGKYVRINVTSVTSTGSGTVVIFGYKGTTASAATGGGGGAIGPTGPQGIQGPTGPAGATGPAGSSSDLSGSGDFTVVRNNSTVLTLGPACSSTAPCRADFGSGTGSTTCTLTTPATATISAGSAQAYIYWTDACVLTLGDNTNTVVCSGCTHTGSIAAFPATSIPLWNWTATAGTWDVLGGTNQIKPVAKSADPLATYYLSSADAQLKNAVNLGALTTGVLKITVAGSVATPSSVSSTRGLSFTFTGGGAAIASGSTLYLRVPFACTIVDYSIMSTTAETVTLKLWRVATGGTAIPAVGNSISTSGVSLSSGTAVYSTTVSDFTSLAIAANDLIAANITAITASEFVNYTIGCQQ